jgi:hypothetical protein
MPVQRRRTSATQIAKVNARSVEGYFGEGTPCFFIRGTILADHQVNGEYRTLAIHRAGNLIAIEAFDGEWALVAITTREDAQHGGIFARLWLRDSDLKSVRIDCERILAGFEAVAVPAGARAAGEAVEAIEPAAVSELDWPVLATDTPTLVHPEPPPAGAPPPFVPAPEPPRSWASRVAPIVENVVAAFRDGKIFVEVGASVVAIALPVVVYVLRAYFNSRRND